MYAKDTIAGIATAPGTGGISIIRVSGDNSLKITASIFKCSGPPLEKRPDKSAVYGHIYNETLPVDEVIVIIMRAPHSYTKENVVEIQCHGGYIAAQTIMQLLTNAGARPAEPGEFTKRAFLNGRLDLVQAEAVLDIINARSSRAAIAAMEQLDGHLSSLLTDLYNNILSAQTQIEVSLDFDEEELLSSFKENIKEELVAAGKKTTNLLSTWEEGHLLREGATVAIAGLPNVGKSTLLNALLKKDRAIVSEIPGTTRDLIEENFLLNGINLRLIDTAGLRNTDCSVEQQGVSRAKSQILKADLILYVLDSSQPLSADDKNNIATVTPDKSILVKNKTDLGEKEELLDYEDFTIIKTCMIHNRGVDDLKQAISDKLGFLSHGEPHAVISERHRSLLVQCDNAITIAYKLLSSGTDETFVLAASELRVALEALGTILGKTYHNDLLDAVFSRFCVGK